MASSDNYLSKDKSQVDKAVASMAKGERKRKLAAERKKFRRNRQPKGPRRKNWVPDNLDSASLDELDQEAWYDEEVDDFERIMPIDEGERRRTLENAVSARTQQTAADSSADTDKSSGYNGYNAADTSGLLAGLVVEFGSGLCRVELAADADNKTDADSDRHADQARSLLLCSLRGSLSEQESGFTNPVAVGDRVLVRRNGVEFADGGVVEMVLPRANFLARPDVFHAHLRQLLVANVDQLLIVASWRQPALWLELVDRYLIAAARSHLPALLCINKLDLAEGRSEVEDALSPYAALGIPYQLTSAETGLGVEELRTQLSGRSTVLAGLSGVGKSTLLTAIQPDLALRTAEVSDRRHEGRHTTTQATLLRLDSSTIVVDTPGIREFGLAGLDKTDLAGYFPEIAAVAGDCKFSNCAHINERHCAVRDAVESGRIARQRYHSYRQIYSQLN